MRIFNFGHRLPHLVLGIGLLAIAGGPAAAEGPAIGPAFEKTCLARGTNYGKLAKVFGKSGWTDMTNSPPEAMGHLISAFERERAQMPEGSGFDKQAIFVSDGTDRVLYAWISLFHTTKSKGISCQIYDFDGKLEDLVANVPPSLAKIPPHRDEQSGTIVLNWRSPSTYQAYASINLMYVPKGSKIAAMMGASGVSMTTSAKVQE